MLIKIISYLPAILGILTVGLFVLVNNPKNVKNRIFAGLNLFIATWLLCLFIGDTTHHISVALWALRFAGFFSALMFLFFYYFALVFPFSVKTNKWRVVLVSMPMILVALTSFTSLQVSTVTIEDFGVQPEKIGPLYTFLDILGLIYLILGIVVLFKKYKQAEPQAKNQIKFVLFGLFIAIAVNVTTGLVLTLLKIDTKVILFGGFSLFIFSIFIAYAIIKHRLFDIRLIVARSVAYILLLSSLAAMFAFGVLGVTGLIFRGQQPGIALRAVYTILAIILAFLLQPLKRFFDRLTNRLFYQDAYDTQVFLDQFNKVLVSNLELESLLTDAADVIKNNLKTDKSAFLINKTEHVPQRMIGALHFKFNENISTENDIYGLLNHSEQDIIILDDIESGEQARLREFLRLNNIALIVRLNASQGQRKENIGHLLLTNKKSGSPYNQQDVKAVNIIAKELVIAIQNALRFEEIQNFNLTLQQKVDDATHKLRQTNEKLKALDETKDEFISMASHQLRTPLTSVKGYISMVMEGDAGKVSDMQKKLLDQAFISSQRMVYLIADLLNVSRLRTGKFVIERKPTQLADVIETEISQLTETAKGRNLELTYEKPKNFPKLLLDETKIRQVIMNFADNAIYYTQSGTSKGHIHINLIDTGKSVEFTVVDDGIGVPKDAQHHLFTKFYRADNAQHARPDGTGLGLFMAKKVVIAQGGAIIFKSEEGKGSTFGFSFPKDKLLAAEVIKKK